MALVDNIRNDNIVSTALTPTLNSSRISLTSASRHESVQESFTFGLVLVQQVLTDIPPLVLLVLHEHPWNPPGSNFAISQE